MRGVYGQWSAWLADFAEGKEDVPLDSLPPVRIEDVGARAAARTCQRCVDSLNQRMRYWSQRFSRDLEHSHSASDVRRALGCARIRLVPMRALAASPLLFDELRDGLQQQLQTVLDEAQHDLERHALAAGTEREVLLRIVREQPVNRAVCMDLSNVPPDPSSTLADRSDVLQDRPNIPSTRRVLIG